MIARLTLIAACAVALAACAPKPEPVPVTIQPSYTKLGQPICPAGYSVATDTLGNTVCAPI